MALYELLAGTRLEHREALPGGGHSAGEADAGYAAEEPAHALHAS